jgi:exosome complex exonuclease RRP6
METSEDFKSWQDKLQARLLATTRTANSIASNDLAFQRTVNPDVDEQLNDLTARLLQFSSELLSASAKSRGQKAPELEDTDDIDAKWPAIVDIIDNNHERTDTCLDEYTGVVKRKSAPAAEAVSRTPQARAFRVHDMLK